MEEQHRRKRSRVQCRIRSVFIVVRLIMGPYQVKWLRWRRHHKLRARPGVSAWRKLRHVIGPSPMDGQACCPKARSPGYLTRDSGARWRNLAQACTCEFSPSWKESALELHHHRTSQNTQTISLPPRFGTRRKCKHCTSIPSPKPMSIEHW